MMLNIRRTKVLTLQGVWHRVYVNNVNSDKLFHRNGIFKFTHNTVLYIILRNKFQSGEELHTWFAFCWSSVMKKPLRIVFRGCCELVCLAAVAGVVPDDDSWPAALFSILDILFRAFWIISISCCVSHMELLIKPGHEDGINVTFCIIFVE